MDSVIIVLFGVLGGFLGILMPVIIRRIILNKCRKKGIAAHAGRCYDSLFFRVAVCILNTAAWAIVGLRTENIIVAVIISVLLSMAVVIAAVDLEIRIIPNELVVGMIVLGAAYQALSAGISAMLVSLLCMAGMVLLFFVAALITGLGMIGAGDVKLAGAMGVVLGYPDIMVALAIMGVALVIYSSVGLVTKKLNLNSTLAFAPFIMLGMTLSLAKRVIIG